MRRGLFGRLGKLGLNLMIQPNISPIIFLTQWKMLGNSQVHTDPYLTSWKVSGNSQVQQYLTQWKVSGNSEVHTLPYPDGVVLPTGYKRCKYLEFHGTEYIDSGIIPEQNIKIETKFSFSQLTNNSIFGCRVSAWSNDSLYCYLSNDSYFLISYGGRIIDQLNNPIPYNTANEIIELDLDASTLNIQKGGNTYTVNVTREIVKGTNNLFIGKINGLNIYYQGKLFLFIIKIGNNLLFNGIPCLDDNNVPCLYDTVSGTSFYNDGTGTFGYELYPQPTEIWSCGDYSSIDNKYHVKISDGSNVYDIALTEPLRKVNDVADTIEFPSSIEGKALVTRNLSKDDLGDLDYVQVATNTTDVKRYRTSIEDMKYATVNILTAIYNESRSTYACIEGINTTNQYIFIYDVNYNQVGDTTAFINHVRGSEIFYELTTPTTELVDAPQIAVSPTYTSANETPYSAFTYANPLIYSCGDLGQDGKYHVKISNGVDIYDIALDEPLRKVNDVADTIEFPSDTEGKALVTRPLGSYDLGILNYAASDNGQGHVRHTTSITNIPNCKAPGSSSTLANILCAIYETKLPYPISTGIEGIGLSSTTLSIHDDNYNATDSETKAAFKAHLNNVELIYELATPTTELIDVSPFPVSSTDTYTSANVTPYSAFEYKKNVEIWSCGEYSEIDNKYHIVVLPQGKSPVDIALDAPLRKVNDVADTIEFPSSTDGKALVTRNLKEVDMGNFNMWIQSNGVSGIFWVPSFEANTKNDAQLLCVNYSKTTSALGVNFPNMGIRITYNYQSTTEYRLVVRNESCSNITELRASLQGQKLIYELETPTTELVDAPQIAEADSYSMVITPGGKAVSWSSFETD